MTFKRCISNNQSYPFWQSIGSSNAFGSFTYKMEYYSKNRNQKADVCDDATSHQEILAWYRWPAWLMNRAWHLHATKIHSGWDFKFRQYNIIPYPSLVFDYARDGNVIGLQGLFDDRLASPYDCDSHGVTPLHVRTIGILT